MKKVTLHIETRDENRTISLEDELSIGRTDSASLVLDDIGLSRVNTTFFRDGEMILVVDENSLNGTFLNGEKVGNRPVRVFDGDTLKLGVETSIRVEIESEKAAVKANKAPEVVKANTTKAAPNAPKKSVAVPDSPPKKPPLIIIGAVVSSFLIVVMAAATIAI